MLSMATVVREYVDEQGRALREYDTGQVHDAKTGYIVKPKPVITRENAHLMHAARIAKTEKAIRDEITAKTAALQAVGADGLPVKLSGASHAVGIAAGVLWESVIAPGKNDRLIDRVRAFETITKTAKLVEDPKNSVSGVTPEQAAGIGGAVAAILHEMIAAERERRSHG